VRTETRGLCCCVVAFFLQLLLSLYYFFFHFFAFPLCTPLLITSFNGRLRCLGLLHTNSSGATVAYLSHFLPPLLLPGLFLPMCFLLLAGVFSFTPRSPCVSGARRMDVEQEPPSSLRPPRCFCSSWPSIWPSLRSQGRVLLLCICCQAHFLLLTARAAFPGLVRNKRRRRRKCITQAVTCVVVFLFFLLLPSPFLLLSPH
jgi:hypothetical protein